MLEELIPLVVFASFCLFGLSILFIAIAFYFLNRIFVDSRAQELELKKYKDLCNHKSYVEELERILKNVSK